MAFNLNRLLAFMLLCTGLVTGCGSGEAGPPEYAAHLVTVSGEVTQEGKPLSKATVTFHPNSEGAQIATGVTDEQGQFKLFTPIPGAPIEQTQGAAPGKYQVTVSQIRMPDGSPIPDGTTEADAMALDAKESLPAEFSDPEKTTLTAEVIRGQNTPIKFEISK